MYHLFLAIVIVLLSSCSTTHHHHNYGKSEKEFMSHHKIVHHNYIDRGDHIQVIIKHKPKLSKRDRKRIRRWCHQHYGHHKKKIRYKFIIAG